MIELRPIPFWCDETRCSATSVNVGTGDGSGNSKSVRDTLRERCLSCAKIAIDEQRVAGAEVFASCSPSARIAAGDSMDFLDHSRIYASLQVPGISFKHCREHTPKRSKCADKTAQRATQFSVALCVAYSRASLRNTWRLLDCPSQVRMAAVLELEHASDRAIRRASVMIALCRAGLTDRATNSHLIAYPRQERVARRSSPRWASIKRFRWRTVGIRLLALASPSIE